MTLLCCTQIIILDLVKSPHKTEEKYEKPNKNSCLVFCMICCMLYSNVNPLKSVSYVLLLLFLKPKHNNHT